MDYSNIPLNKKRHEEGERLLLMFSLPDLIKPPKKKYYKPKPKKDPSLNKSKNSEKYNKEYYQKNKEKIQKKRAEKILKDLNNGK